VVAYQCLSRSSPAFRLRHGGHEVGKMCVSKRFELPSSGKSLIFLPACQRLRHRKHRRAKYPPSQSMIRRGFGFGTAHRSLSLETRTLRISQMSRAVGSPGARCVC